MNAKKFVVAAMVAALSFASVVPGVVQAQAPKPLADAKKVIVTPKSGTLNFTGDEYGFFQASTQVRDFDALFSVTNPELPEFTIGIDFRVVTFSRFYALLILSTGETGLLVARGLDQKMELQKEPVFAPSWKRNVGERNDVALYVRGTQALLFINKQFIETYDVSEINDFGDVHLLAAGGAGQSGEIAYKNFTVKVPNNALPPTSNGPTNNNIVVSLYRSGYTQWGRPIGMVDPRQGCQSFNDGSPVLQFQAVMKITNNTKTPMKRWAPLAIKRDGTLAFGCALAYDTSPEIAPGASADITVEYYIEKTDAIASIFVFDLEQGRSNRLQTAAP